MSWMGMGKIVSLMKFSLLSWMMLLGLVLSSPSQDVHISVYYYPWYDGGISGGERDRILRFRLNPSQPPILGAYDTEDREVIAQHVQWAEEFGINNFISSWWGPDNKTDRAALQHLEPELEKTDLTYCLFYEATGRIGMGDVSGGNVDRMRSDAAYMAREHFSSDSYYKIDGKPVLYIYLTRTLTGQVVNGFEAMRQAVKGEGFDDLYIVGDENYWGPKDGEDNVRHSFNNIERLGAMDAVSAYNMHGGGTFNHDGYPQDTDLIAHIRQAYVADKAEAEANGVKFIPGTFPGFNDKAQRDGNYVIPRKVHPDSSHTSTFSQYLEMALEFLDDDILALTVNSWNEWYEDSNIEPVERTGTTNRDGYEYTGYGTDHLQVLLDARNALIPTDTVPIDTTPIDTTPIDTTPIKSGVSGQKSQSFTVTSGSRQTVYQVPFSVQNLYVYDLIGNILHTHSTEENRIDLGNNRLEPGIYFLQLQAGESRKIFKYYH